MMRRGTGLLLAVMVSSSCAVVGAPATPAPSPARYGAHTGVPPRPAPGDVTTLPPVRTFSEVRALWVIRSTMTSEAEILAMVETADHAGFNTILVQVRGRADAFYQSRWEPRGAAVTDPAPFDPLSVAIREAHARGIAVHAWVNTHLVSGPAALPTNPDHLVNAHPEWLAVPKALGHELFGIGPNTDGFAERLRRYAAEHAATVEGVYSSPSHPAVKERVYSVWMDLAERYDLDGIHFDYVRFPSSDFDYSRGALERFRVWISPRLEGARLAELEAQSASDPYAFVEGLPTAWDDFRRAQVTDLVRRIYYGVKARKPALVVSAAVFSNQDDAFRFRFQEWSAWLDEGILDVAVPMAYTSDAARFTRLVQDARASTGDATRLWAGIGAYLNSADGTLAQIDIARAEGAGGVVVFSYDWAVTDGSVGQAVPLLERIGRERFGRR